MKAWFDKFLATGSVINSVEVCVGVFPKRKSKKFSLPSIGAPLHLPIKHRGDCTCHVR
jgi:hypothetical protein